MDFLADLLSSLRLTGGVVVDGQLTGEFCLPAQFTPEECAPFFPAPEMLIGYHYIRSGNAIIHVDGQEPAKLTAGDIAILPRNDPHVLASRVGLQPAKASEMTLVTDAGVHRISTGSDGPATQMWCGVLGTAKANAHPILNALPPLLILNTRDRAREWIDSSLRFLAEEQPSLEILSRLAELFLAQAIQDYLAQLPTDSSGWIRGLADPAVSRALSIIHNRYAEELSVEQLAREAGVSRSVLGERFVDLLGEPPMRYCARWRMRMAANMLRDGKQNSANIAYSVGFNSEAAFNRAFKREYGQPPATWKRTVEEQEKLALERLRKTKLPPQEVRYCTGRDGTLLAWSAVGEGPPLVKTANWLNHIEFDWESPIWKHWLLELTDGRTLIRYDERGNGMSAWDTPELSFEAFVDDLERVVEAAGVGQFDLLAISQGAAVAIAYSIRHPGRVRRMILYGGYARGWAVRLGAEETLRREAMLTLTKTGWGSDNPAYRQLFTSLYVPDATPEQMDWYNELQRKSASPDNAVKLQRVLSTIDVSDLLPQVTVPTLVAHARDDQVIPFACGEELAGGIPGAKFVALEGRNHILLESEPAWQEFVRASRAFLGDDRARRPVAAQPKAPPPDSIRTCSSADGVRIAYATCGEGYPVVKAPNCVTHLQHDRSNPLHAHWIAELSSSHRLIRCDMRGFGMSEWEPVEFSLDAHVSDLAAVIDASGVEQCDLVGLTHGAAIAIAYAARNPQRVRKLVLLNSFPAGWAVRADPAELAWRESLMELNRKRWRREKVALGERFVSLYFPSSAGEMVEWHKERFDELCTAASIERMLEWGSRIDIRDELGQVRAETLVVHAAHDGNAPLEIGRQVADAIDGARFVELDSANHFLLENEPAWPVFVREMRAFLAS